MPYFFFGYPRRDRLDPLLSQFFDDLCFEFSVRAGVDLAEAGFRDVDMPTGTRWSPATAEALRTARLFVPIYSPGYFTSDLCGREWTAFTRRKEVYRTETGVCPPVVLPVRWERLWQDLPPPARDVQDNLDRFCPEYRTEGLRSLMQVKDKESLYRDFLVKFTIEMVRAANDHVLPDGPVPELLSTPSAFRFFARDTAGSGGPKCVATALTRAGSGS